jgi:hypothetical protein
MKDGWRILEDTEECREKVLRRNDEVPAMASGYGARGSEDRIRSELWLVTRYATPQENKHEPRAMVLLAGFI